MFLFLVASTGFMRSGSPKCAFTGRNHLRFSPCRVDPTNSRHTVPYHGKRGRAIIRFEKHGSGASRCIFLSSPRQRTLSQPNACLPISRCPGASPDLLLLAVRKPARRHQLANAGGRSL